MYNIDSIVNSQNNIQDIPTAGTQDNKTVDIRIVDDSKDQKEDILNLEHSVTKVSKETNQQQKRIDDLSKGDKIEGGVIKQSEQNINVKTEYQINMVKEEIVNVNDISNSNITHFENIGQNPPQTSLVHGNLNKVLSENGKVNTDSYVNNNNVSVVHSRVNNFNSEVKHALTPLNIVSQQPTHSPQLPIPSPNYPVQTRVIQTDAPPPANQTQSGGCSNNQNHHQYHNIKSINDLDNSNKVQLINASSHLLPNNTTYVPIINNNYINSPHTTSQNNSNNVVVGKIEDGNENNRNCGNGDNELSSLLVDKIEIAKVTLQNALRSSEDLITKKEMRTLKQILEEPIAENDLTLNTTSFMETAGKDGCTPPIIQPNMQIGDGRSLFNSIPVPTTKTNNGFTVLNVPNVTFQPPPKKPKLSKIDVATMRKKLRREKRMKPRNSENKQPNKENISKNGDCSKKYDTTTDFGVKVCGYSDSSNSSVYSTSDCESEYSDIDISITSGPPLKLDNKPEKLSFLQVFGLTTHSEKNSK